MAQRLVKDALTSFGECLRLLGLGDDECTEALSLAKCIRAPRGEILLHQGACQEHGYYIVDGILGAQHYGDCGGLFSKEFYFEGELCLLYHSLLTCDVAPYQLEAATDVTLVRFSLAQLKQASWQPVLIALLSQQLLYKEEKEAFLLLKRPEERYLYLVNHRPMWVERLSNLQLARYIGITPVSLSRLKARLA
ncbi:MULTISPECIES: Crp/Fnr family transcriptional regulator [Shewanella]|uniref:Crp/Fnr family transcriptional regulator n=1 Tax=Shewanella TaxID=22 RepID=UPI001EFCA399|nr:Crp/Fnr family transcriptional regulator [Shewanella sp. Isolate8]MCL2908764.1 Crp/Fnr family transcriptional regulator [Shewanella aquimarina]